ncbi:MAG: hypothetical protein NVS3B5_15020 [Sphingomicrobium sp.]
MTVTARLVKKSTCVLPNVQLADRGAGSLEQIQGTLSHAAAADSPPAAASRLLLAEGLHPMFIGVLVIAPVTLAVALIVPKVTMS